MEKSSSFLQEWTRHTSTGQIISETGVSAVSSGGDTEYLHGTVMTVERW